MYSPILFLFTACNEQHLFRKWTDSDDTEETVATSEPSPGSEPSEPSEPDATEPSQPDSSEPSEPDDSETTPDQGDPGSSEDNPTTPIAGELLINELMIDPSGADNSIQDANGEWIELWNRSNLWLDLGGLLLADAGVDTYEIEAAESFGTELPLLLGPGQYFLICANDDFWENGGVECNATFNYQTFGGGFGLSNSEDEVAIVRYDYAILDVFAYGSGFSVTGGSLGLDPDSADVISNDSMSNWCEQWGVSTSG